MDTWIALCSVLVQVRSLLQYTHLDNVLVSVRANRCGYYYHLLMIPSCRVVYLVTKQSCTYYYSVTNCPTKDNVMVKVEVTLVFRVLKASQFVYSIGATK